MTENAAGPGPHGSAPRREPPLAAAARRLAESRGKEARPADPRLRARPQAGAPAAPAAPVATSSAGPRQWGTTSLSSAAPRPDAAPSWSRPAPPPGPPGPAPLPAAYPATAKPSYSRWWKRVCAALIDAVVLSVPSGIIVALVGGDRLQTDPVTGEVSARYSAALLVAYLLTFLGSTAYYVILEGGRGGATVGKMALNISVRDESSLGSIGYGRALGRRLMANLLWFLLVVPGILDVLAPLWSSRRQTWHDNIVGSVVVDKA